MGGSPRRRPFPRGGADLESGLLVWVVFVIARLVGMKGLSWKGIAFVTVLLAGYSTCGSGT